LNWGLLLRCDLTHEVPQEVGDFLVLLHSGYSKRQALGSTFCQRAMVVGGSWLFRTTKPCNQLIRRFRIAAAACSCLDKPILLPGLHRRRGLLATAQQAFLIAAGIGTIWVVAALATSLRCENSAASVKRGGP